MSNEANKTGYQPLKNIVGLPPGAEESGPNTQIKTGAKFYYLGGIFTIGTVSELDDIIYIKDDKGIISDIPMASFKSLVRNGTYVMEESNVKTVDENDFWDKQTDVLKLQSHITKLEDTNSQYKKQISEYEFHLIEARRIKDNFKLKLERQQNIHAEYLREVGEKFIELEARNKELEEALLKIQEWQMDYIELARSTKVYQIAEQALNKK